MLKVKEYDGFSIVVSVYKEYERDGWTYTTLIETIKGQDQCKTNTWQKFNQFLSFYCEGRQFEKISNMFEEVFQ